MSSGIPERPEGSEDSRAVDAAMLNLLRRRCAVLNQENRELRRELAVARGEMSDDLWAAIHAHDEEEAA